jgi:hypothetical protein
MTTKLWLFALLFLSRVCAAQVPVNVQLLTQDNQADQAGQRFLASLQSEIRLSSKFYLWTGHPIDMPPTGIQVLLVTVETKLNDGHVLGSAVVAIAEHFSQKDRGAERLIFIRSWSIPKDDLVGDITREYLAALVGQ